LALDVDATRVTGRWVKHSYPGADPLAPRDPPPDNRWQHGDVVDAVYLAEEPDTAWAEWYRHLAERGVPPNDQMPRDLWACEVDVDVADLSSPERLARVKLTPPRPGRRTWPSYQHVGEALAAEGWDGLLSTSAARPAHFVICLFRAPDHSIPGARLLPPPTRVDEPPAPPTGMTT
jgi:RES domain-containing protein